MIVRDGILGILEHAYAPTPDESAWLEGIRETTSIAFEGHLSVQAYTLNVEQSGKVQFGSIAGETRHNDPMLEWHDALDANDTRGLYLSGPVARVNDWVRRSKNERLQRIHRHNIGKMGHGEILGAIGMNSDGRACVLAFILPQSRLPTATRSAVARIAGHLAASYRLRGREERKISSAAVLKSDGELVDARADLDPEHRLRLRQAALAIDRARRLEKSAPATSLSHWKAMVEGKWSLVERVEADGRRIFVAAENEPRTRRLRALSKNEAKVVALSALCHPSKLVAYELGVTEGRVSQLLKSALAKLGVRTRAELIELYGALATSATSNDAQP